MSFHLYVARMCMCILICLRIVRVFVHVRVRASERALLGLCQCLSPRFFVCRVRSRVLSRARTCACRAVARRPRRRDGSQCRTLCYGPYDLTLCAM